MGCSRQEQSHRLHGQKLPAAVLEDLKVKYVDLPPVAQRLACALSSLVESAATGHAADGRAGCRSAVTSPARPNCWGRTEP